MLTQNDLRGTVMSGGYNGAVVLVVKRCAAEVHHTYCSVLNCPLFSLLQEQNN